LLKKSYVTGKGMAPEISFKKEIVKREEAEVNQSQIIDGTIFRSIAPEPKDRT